MAFPEPFPSETDPPATLLPDLINLRNEALLQADFRSAVLLSHTIAWMNWAQRVFDAEVR